MRQEIKCPEYFNRGNVNNRNWIVLLFIVASCVILGFGVLLMRKSTVMLWIYVIVSLLTIVIECLYIFKHKLLREDIIEKLPKKLSIGYIGFDNFLGFRILKNKELQCFMKDITEIEVVGNIHENKDLLNTKE